MYGSHFSASCRPSRLQMNSSFEYETRQDEVTGDLGFRVSQDGKRSTREAVNVAIKKRRLRPCDLKDEFGAWDPLNKQDPQENEREGGEGTSTGAKRDRYESSDATMKGWRPLANRFLDELLRAEGLGDALDEDRCSCCEETYTPTSRRFRCHGCGAFVQCHKCVISRHALTPLHRIQEWKGGFWAVSSLKSIGCTYQLGHGGHPCPRPMPSERTMVVMDTEYIFTVPYRYCGCDKAGQGLNLEQLLCNRWYPATTVDPATCATVASLELFRLLNVVGNINVHDFVTTLERNTNATYAKAVPDRYKATLAEVTTR
ncbi:hypothetical protein C8R43DRAFT_1143319 [Mycena crocata]|nr:hypothetical protein C8R43DRAFT_1143319 [Mycena crocata]